MGGVDGGRSPSLIDPDQVSYAANVTFRGGFPCTRPGYRLRELDFENDEQQDWYENHQLQGAYTYRAANKLNFDVVSVGGRFFKIDILNGYKVSELTPTKSTATAAPFAAPAIGMLVLITVDDASMIFPGYPIMVNGFRYMVETIDPGNVIEATNLDDPTGGVVASPVSVVYLDPNNPDLRRTWFEQATKWLVCQNGKDAAILFDGSTMRRSNIATDKPEVPTGTVMAFTNNRLWVAVPGNEIAAGDIAGGPTDVIVFSEELAIVGQARFQINDEITAMVKSVTLDTSLGQGPLQVFTRNGVGSINAPSQRSLWNTLNYAIQTVSLEHAGATAQYAVLNVNSDIHYRSPDGWRSFIISRREVSEWGNTPLSSEMDSILAADDISLLEMASAMLIDNRVLFTVGPHLSDNGVYHQTIGVLDFNLISRMGQKSRPIWEGEWSGIRPTLLLAGEFQKVRRGFVFALSEDNRNVLYEIDKMSKDDDGTRITATLETRNFSFVNSGPFDLKRITSFELWVRAVHGTIDFDLKWRPDASEKAEEAPCWYDWNTKQICSTTEDCNQNTNYCKTIKNLKAGYRNRLGFGQPPDDDCEPQTQTPPRLGFEHQVKLTWTGHAAIKKFKILADVVEEEVFPPCEED